MASNRISLIEVGGIVSIVLGVALLGYLLYIAL